MPDSRKRFADTAFLLALCFYMLAGTWLVPEHGDEYMLTAMARDVFYMARGDWNRLAYTPPVQIDSEQYLRLINGTINKTLIGVVWLLSGRSADSLPGIYVWTMPRDWNQRQGHILNEDDLRTARLPSALMMALGVFPAFLIGWNLRLRSLAYPTTLLYALHPAILLNGRRAMMEGSLMLFTLATMAWLVSLIVAEHSAKPGGFWIGPVRRLSPALRYAILGMLCGLTLASKHTGVVVAGAALVTVLLTGLARDRSWRPAAWTGYSAGIMLVVFLLLNPAYWNNPLGAARYAITARTELLSGQTGQSALAYTDFGQRLGALVTQPFIAEPQFYESDTWAGQLDKQIETYRNSAVDGWEWGTLIGAAVTLLAGLGLLSLISDALHRDLIALAVLIWTGATLVAALAIPLAWQRYYLPLILVAIVLAAAGLGRLMVRRSEAETRIEAVEQPSS